MNAGRLLRRVALIGGLLFALYLLIGIVALVVGIIVGGAHL